MKKLKTLFVAAFVLFAFVETSAQFSVGTDIYSSYVFRGVKFGSGPAIQPYVDYSNGGFSVGAWGSVTYASDYQEMDLYASYTTGGLTLGVYDYYYPGTAFFDVSDTTGSHGIELNLGYEVDGFSIAANYIVNEAPGAGTVGGDKYFELGYAFETFSLFVGAGDGWHSSDTEFQLVNVGISTSKEVKISESFSLPVSGAVILNPDSEQFFIVVGISL